MRTGVDPNEEFRECALKVEAAKNKPRKKMRFDKTLLAIAGVAIAAWTPAQAYEVGAAGWAQKPGITLGGSSAGVPPPGLYMVDQAFTYQSNLAGPGNSVLNPHGTTTGVPAAVGAGRPPSSGFLAGPFSAQHTTRPGRYRWACLLPAVR